MQSQIIDQIAPKFKTYFSEFINKISDKENKEQILFLQKKANHAISISKK